MFHPTIFDNLKVVLEGAVYDRDFDGEIVITNRADLVDLASYNRLYQIDYQLVDEAQRDNPIKAQIQLRSGLIDIAAEQLEKPLAEEIGCTICIHFHLKISNVNRESGEVIALLHDIWGGRPHITQLISSRLDEHRLNWPPSQFENNITLDFHRKIGEGNIEDLRGLVDHSVKSLMQLRDFYKG